MPENNSITDIRYKLLMRMIGELELTRDLVSDDNPYQLSSSEVDEFKAFRKAWVDVAHGDISGIHIDYNSEMLLRPPAGTNWPAYPTGWYVMTRSVGDLPPILVHEDRFDTYDSSIPEKDTDAPNPG